MKKLFGRELKKADHLKIAKYVAGSMTAVVICGAMKLRFAYAAGIIAILTIQDTKKETVKIALKRLLIFAIMTLMSKVIFHFLGYGVWSFGILLIPYLMVCMALDMKETITSIAVLCTHYVTAESCGIYMVLNELALLVTGSGVGILLNMFMPDTTKKLEKYQAETDDMFAGMLKDMAGLIAGEGKNAGNDKGSSGVTGKKSGEGRYKEIRRKNGAVDGKGEKVAELEYFAELEELLYNFKREAIRYMHNRFTGENDYYYEYMQMRMRQCNILKHIYDDVMRVGSVPAQAAPLADFLNKAGDNFREKNGAAIMLEELGKLEKSYARQELPSDREEFEGRAILYHILKDLEVFLEIGMKNLKPNSDDFALTHA